MDMLLGSGLNDNQATKTQDLILAIISFTVIAVYGLSVHNFMHTVWADYVI